MRTLLTGLVCLLLAGMAVAQANSEPELKPRVNTPVQELPTATGDQKVSPDAAVVTIDGLCDKPATAGDCKTVVTRAEFERIVNALQPNMTKQQQKAFATNYAMALVLAQKAHEQGLDNGPGFEEQLRVQMQLTRLQLLARLGQEGLQKQAAQVSDADVEAYYKQHSSDFQTISYDRLFIPKQKQTETASKPDAPNTQKQRDGSEAAMKEEADKLRARAMAGEDFTRLQQEAYDFAGQKLKATTTRVDNVARAHFPPSDISVFDLKVGEVSPVLINPQAYMIYKIEAKKDQPLEDLKPEISRALQQQKVQEAFQGIRKSATDKTKYDDAYFAGSAPPSLNNPAAPSAPGAPATPAQPSGKTGTQPTGKK